MSIALPEIRVGDPLRHKSLSVFPLFSHSDETVDYRLSESALADGSLLIEEVDQSGSVPSLLVENKGDIRVLVLDGEELVGANQNRVLNTSVLVAAHSKIKIPVSCVEKGRWESVSRYFRSSGSHAPSKLRRALKGSVSKAVKENIGHQSDQNEVWEEVEDLHFHFRCESETTAMADAFDLHRDQIAAYRDQLPYVRNASGLAIAIGDKVVSVDLFDKPKTCQEVWNRMLTGVVFDAMEVGETDQVASVSDVEQLIASVVVLPWNQCDAVGDGEEFRASSDDGDHASTLVLDETVVHGSVLSKA